ncbi:MAG: hypothetical protein P1V20_27235 [Verrucomicrobiales bacterium]|nr:hypothetical protein [Verrucomicrobiales bacterium]
MAHGYLLIVADTEPPNTSLLLTGIALGILFFLIGSIVGLGVWRRCHRELNRFEEENRRLSRSARIRKRNHLKQQKDLARLSRKD